MRLRRLLRHDLRRLEPLLRLSVVLWLGGATLMLLLLHQVIVHLVLHFCSLLGAAQAVRWMARGADGVEPLL